VTEIPEHLLRRSRERRAALGQGDGGAPVASTDEGGTSESAASPAATPATTQAAAAPAPVEAAPPAVVDEPPSPMALADQAARRSRVPMWAAPVLVVLPMWAFLYAGAFGERHKAGPVDPLVLGQQVYSANGCSGCHGASGEGGVGPALKGGDAKVTFPDEADHISWVKTGSAPFAGKPYGDPNRPGGQRMAKGLMPGFAGTLSQQQIEAVVKYEREKL
jgi:mono/diheme cytochrome c family protein